MEIWKDIPGHEGRYQVSNQGRVCGPSGKVLKPNDNGRGYWMAHLSGGARGKRAARLIHRLVAAAFLPPMPGKAHVNHKDANKNNNAATNLEWCTPLENAQHAKALGLLRTYKHGVEGLHLRTGKRVVFESMKHAEVALSGTGKQSSAINHFFNGKKKSAYGYVWRRIT